MPIFKLLAVTGPILVGLLFLANATLAPRGPLFTNESVGLSRSQPARPQVAELTPEPPRPRAPRLVPDEPPRPAVAIPAWAEAPAPAPLPAFVETRPAPVAAATTPQIKTAPDRTEVAKPEVAKPEVAKTAPTATAPTTKSAKVETTGTGAAKPAANKRAAKNSEASKREAVTTETRKAAPAPQTRKPVVRKHDRDHSHAAYRGEGARDHVPIVENGYAYGVRPGSERRESQRSWDGGFNEQHWRF